MAIKSNTALVWQKFNDFLENCITIKLHEALYLNDLITESFLKTESWMLRE